MIPSGMALGAMPARVVQHDDNPALAPGVGFTGEAGEQFSEMSFEMPLQRYQTASPLVGCTKAATSSHWHRW
jgi:hypothetical protein